MLNTSDQRQQNASKQLMRQQLPYFNKERKEYAMKKNGTSIAIYKFRILLTGLPAMGKKIRLVENLLPPKLSNILQSNASFTYF